VKGAFQYNSISLVPAKGFSWRMIELWTHEM
jgi:hypothetical protein